MKRIVLPAWLLLAVIGASPVGAQDIHFSQFYASPLTLNPALTGVFNGKLRFAAHYRNQWRSVTPGAFNTLAASADMSFLKRSLGKDYLGLGVNVFHDRAGDGNLGLTFVGLSLAYSKALSRRSKQYLSFGAQFGFTQRSVDYQYLVFNSQFDGTTVGDFASSREPLTKSKYFNWDNSVGLLWYMAANDDVNVYAGFALSHISGPNQSFYIDGDIPLFMKYTVHGGVELNTSDHFVILPKLLYLRQGPAQEINIGATTRVIPSPHKHGFVNSFYAGAMYRFTNFTSPDALILLAGGEYRNVNIGLTFDLNISRLVEASLAVGGPEVSITYTVPEPKMGGSRNVRYCPDGISF